MSLFKSLAGVGGSALGNVLLPGVGGVIGGWAASKLAGGLSGGQRGGAEDLRSQLLKKLQAQATAPVTASATFQAGRQDLTDALDDQEARDEGDLASMGARGGEASIAMAARRGKTLTSGLTRLLASEGRRQDDAVRTALAVDAGDRDRDERRSAGRMNLLGQGAAALATSLPDLLYPADRGGKAPTPTLKK